LPLRLTVVFPRAQAPSRRSFSLLTSRLAFVSAEMRGFIRLLCCRVIFRPVGGWFVDSLGLPGEVG